MWASWVPQPPDQAIQEDRGLPVWLCSLGSCTRRTSACVKNTPATCTWPVFVCISQCSHSVPPPSILVRDIFPTGESLKDGMEIKLHPSLLPAWIQPVHTWRAREGKVRREEFAKYLLTEWGWMLDSTARGFIWTCLLQTKFPTLPHHSIKFHCSNFKSHRLAPHIALALWLRLWFSTHRGYWRGSDEQQASRPDSTECRSHISKHVELKRDIGLGISQDGALVIYRVHLPKALISISELIHCEARRG